jgi:sulfide dehydrogenase cytochrome subunit
MQKAVLRSAFVSCLLMAGSAQAELNISGLANTCNNCHGTGGVSAGESMPSIAGLPEDYLKNIMMEWKTGKRPSANMTRLIKGYTDEEIAALATYFSKQPWVPVKQKTDAKLVKLGKKITEKCSGCHGDTGKAPDAETPNLHGQWSQYLQLEALKYRDDAFGMPNRQMVKAAKKLSDEEIKAVAEFYASQNK